MKWATDIVCRYGVKKRTEWIRNLRTSEEMVFGGRDIGQNAPKTRRRDTTSHSTLVFGYHRTVYGVEGNDVSVFCLLYPSLTGYTT